MAMAGATPLLPGFPDEIVIWEILLRLPPKSLLRCRAIGRAWCCVVSTRSFLLAHHNRQPALPISVNRNILAFDHRAAANDQLQTIARLDEVLNPQASCDGLFVLSRLSPRYETYDVVHNNYSICNPATRQHAPLGIDGHLRIMGMYPHRPTGGHRLLLHLNPTLTYLLPNYCDGCYVFTLGSDLPPRYIGSLNPAHWCLDLPALLHDNLHWFPSLYYAHAKQVIVFDTIAETFRQMRTPDAPNESRILEMDGTLGIYHYGVQSQIVDIWVLQNYETEVWDFKYRIKVPAAEIWGQFEGWIGGWAMNVVSMDGDVLLLVSFGQWLLHIDSDGKLVGGFHRDGQGLSLNGLRLKQTLVSHTFFPALEGYAVNASPFI